MKRLVSAFLFAAFLAIAMSACGPSPTPTEAPPEQPMETPTEAPMATPTEEPTSEGPSLGDIWTRPADGMEMVYVPAGEFEMGSDDDEVDDALATCSEVYGECQRDQFEDEQPAHTVALDGFWIDRTEVTNAQYRLCVEAGSCDEPLLWDLEDFNVPDQPVVFVDWHQANAYCEWAGGRLPIEAEWEYAARGPEGLVFPWGDAFDGTRLNYCDANCEFVWTDGTFDDGYTHVAPVGSFPAGASWCGALDMAGNVLEWVMDWYAGYSSGRQVSPTGPSSGESRVLRGGSWNWCRAFARCASRHGLPPDSSNDIIGIRCAKGVEP